MLLRCADSELVTNGISTSRERVAESSAAEIDRPQSKLHTLCGSFEQELALDRLIYFGRREVPPELTLPELLSRVASTEFARRLLRSLLCLFAALVALLAVARASRAFTLPLAALILMGIDVANSALLGRATSISPATGVAAAVAALLVLLALYHQVLARQDGLLKAVLGKV